MENSPVCPLSWYSIKGSQGSPPTGLTTAVVIMLIRQPHDLPKANKATS